MKWRPVAARRKKDWYSESCSGDSEAVMALQSCPQWEPRD